MRAFHLLVSLMALLVATAFAGNVQQRSLRIAVDDTEERGASSILHGLKTKAKDTTKTTYLVAKDMAKAKYQKAEAKLKQKWMEGDMLSSIKKGESKDSLLTRLGAKSHIDEKGNKVFDPNDHIVKTFDRMAEYINKKKPQ